MEQKTITQHTALEYKRRVCLAMNYISQNLDQELSLEEIAQQASFSMFHFHRIFKAVVGETIAEFTRRIRLEVAANHLLYKPNDSITTIALHYAFSSSQNFSKAFRQHFKMTPSAYRKQKRKFGNNPSNKENVLSLKATYAMTPSLSDLPKINRSIEVKAEIKTLPEYHVAYVRKIGPYGPDTCEKAFNELCQWAAPKGLLNTGIVLGVYWDNPEVTPPEKCRVDACITLPPGATLEDPIATQTLQGGPFAVCHFEVKPDQFQQAWDNAFTWLVDNGYECGEQPCYEIYYNNASDYPEGKWIFDICIPLLVKP
ncbi:AraC family transcriptional regulator [Zooshikella harenae]|uniref:AraC family transcriptional regulator n=1 Tax=Zooshikella harenae TaxID=2827238 RepID=A0ABS5ZFR3_9GAMM|nr:AraC family transcriptional regulator [Zooshikella harenae]MBU2711822.1 AraC family transcriptional regulator [Zooshikella harenae]